jgi:hypothetical protein
MSGKTHHLRVTNVHIAKAGDLNETMIWTVLKNALPLRGEMCYSASGYVVYRLILNQALGRAPYSHRVPTPLPLGERRQVEII